MAGKTNTDLIRELSDSLARLEERVRIERQDVVRLDNNLTKFADQIAKLDNRLTVLEVQLQEVKKYQEEERSMRRSVWLALLGSVLTLVVNIVLFFVRK